MIERDTRPEAHSARIAIYRRIGGPRRLALALEMSDDARAIALAGVRARHPDYDEAQAASALLHLLLGDAVFRTAWPDRELLAP